MMMFGGILAVTLLAAPTTAAVAATEPAEVAFRRLHTLIGDWEAKTDGGAVIKLGFRLMAGDSILVETFTGPSGRQTLTIYHLDGSDLIATHYCAQGNQPRLRLEKADADSLAFGFVEATNLSRPGADHMDRLLVEFLDARHFKKSETYAADGVKDTTVLSFTKER